LSIKETAASLGYSTRTIWRMIDRQVLPEPSAHPGGRKKYFLRSVIDAYIRQLNGGQTA
jgi:predicted DNA-binding transcriptional regulator AlpA